VTTLRQLLAEGEARLAAAGLETPRLDVRLLAGAALGLSRNELLLEGGRGVGDADASRFQALLERRLAREPVSRILGRRGFWNLEFALTPDTLDPRPDTETLVEAVLERLPDRTAPLRLLDLGTGSGCILLALLSELPNARGIGIDLSRGAAAAARGNACSNGLAGRAAFLAGDWASAVRGGGFDIVVSNPPYIPDGDVSGLQPEVALFDPHRALAGGADGLDPYRHLAPELVRLLVPGGLAAVEHGAGQGGDVAALFRGAGLEQPLVIADLSGHDRVVVARKAL